MIREKLATFRRNLTPVKVAIIGWGVMLALGFEAAARRFLPNLEPHTYDMRLRLDAALRPPVDTSESVLMPIDDLAVARYGRWPWSRDRWIPILEALHDLGARAALLDVEFPESSEPVLKRDAAGRTFEQILNDEFPEIEKITRIDLKEALKTTGAADIPQAISALLQEIGHRLGALKYLILSRVRDLDLEMGEAFRRLGGTGMPIFGTFFIVGGTTAADAEVSAALDRYLQLLIARRRGQKSPESEAMLGTLSRMVGRPGRVLATLIDHPLAQPNDPAFALAGVAQDDAEAEIASMRELMMAHVLDGILASEPQLAKDQILQQLATFFGLADTAPFDTPTKKLIEPARARALLLRRFLIPVRVDAQLELPDLHSIEPPILELARSYSGVGVSTTPVDADGIYRRVPLVWRVDDGLIPSNTFVLYLYAIGLDPSRPDVIAKRLRVLPGPVIELDTPRSGIVRIPIDSNATMLLHFQGRQSEVFRKAPLSSVVGYIGLKRELDQVLDRVLGNDGSTRRLRAYSRTAASLMLEPKQMLTYEQLMAKVRAQGQAEVNMDWTDLAPDAHAGDATTARPVSEWDTLSRAALERVEATRFANLKRSVEKFRALPKDKQAAKLANPGSLWPAFLQAWDLHQEVDSLQRELGSRVKNRLAVIGAAQTANTDYGPTSFEEKAPNYALHVHGVQTLLSGRFLHRPAYRFTTALPAIGVCLAVGLVLPAIGIYQGLFWTLMILTIYLMLAVAVFMNGGLWIDVVSPAVGVLTTYLGMSLYRYVTEEARKQEIRKYLNAYVDARAIDRFLAHPELWFQLGGTTCEISAFFSDIEGFTTISELLSAEELSNMLTDYLSPMTDIIQDRGGVRDKFIGDAIVAFFGALEQAPDHARQACLASLEQQERLNQLRNDPRLLADPKSWLSRLKASGLDLKVRIGLNTGQAKVGNFGSVKNRNFTMIGDSVNLAARLEGGNKAFGTSIMISEFTYAQARDHIEARVLDTIRVKGKLVPVTVYELMAAKGKLSPEGRALMDAYNQARAHYIERRFEDSVKMFEECLKIQPDDGPSKTLLKRARAYVIAPPPENWDGVYEMKEK